MKMKNILLLLLLVSFTAMLKAQDSKPTKEQTIGYIVNNYPRSLYVGASLNFAEPGYQPYYTSYSGALNVSFAIAKDTVKVTYVDSLHHTLIEKALGRVDQLDHRYVYHIKFAIKDVEQVFGAYYDFVGSYDLKLDKVQRGCFPFYLFFNAANGQKKLWVSIDNKPFESVSQVKVPFASPCKENDSENVKNFKVNDTQLYKAINHLRKLCGAPEPIKFE